MLVGMPCDMIWVAKMRVVIIQVARGGLNVT